MWAQGLNSPRGMARAANNDLLVVEQSSQQVTGTQLAFNFFFFFLSTPPLWRSAVGRQRQWRVGRAREGAVGQGRWSQPRRPDPRAYVMLILLSCGGKTNGRHTLDAVYLYASSASTVYRWPYRAGVRQNLGTPEVRLAHTRTFAVVVVLSSSDWRDGWPWLAQVVVNSIPTCCDHVTRAIVFDPKGRFYVQLGSGSNVDPNSDVPLPTPHNVERQSQRLTP